MSGGFPASMAATNFCSRSPNVAQSNSAWTLRSAAQFSICLARMSLPAVTKLLKSQMRILVGDCAPAMLSITFSPAAVPPVMTAALRRNSRRAIRPASSRAARSERRRSMQSSSLRCSDAIPLTECGQEVSAPRCAMPRGVDSIVAVQVLACARLSEVVDAERESAGTPSEEPMNDSACECPSRTETTGTSSSSAPTRLSR